MNDEDAAASAGGSLPAAAPLSPAEEVRWMREAMRLQLQPGDVIVISSKSRILTETAERLRDSCQRAFPTHKVAILSEDLQIGALAPAAEFSLGDGLSIAALKTHGESGDRVLLGPIPAADEAKILQAARQLPLGDRSALDALVHQLCDALGIDRPADLSSPAAWMNALDRVRERVAKARG